MDIVKTIFGFIHILGRSSATDYGDHFAGTGRNDGAKRSSLKVCPQIGCQRDRCRHPRVEP